MNKISYILSMLLIPATALFAEQTLEETLEEINLTPESTLEENPSLRRIRVKFFNKVTADELISNKTTYLHDTTISGNLILQRLTGAVIAQNGLITTGQIPASAIPDGSITNAKIADNAVNTPKVAPMTITPDLLAFNTVQTFASEPNPLKIYRGSITGATGAITSGSGFTATRTAAGAYTIDITGPAYTDNASYQVFVQQTTENSPVNPTTIVNVSGSQFTINTVVDHNFSFFTIGN